MAPCERDAILLLEPSPYCQKPVIGWIHMHQAFRSTVDVYTESRFETKKLYAVTDFKARFISAQIGHERCFG